MPASTREIYLLLRARDEASRVVRGFSAELLRSATQAQVAMLRNEAANKRAEAQALRTTAAVKLKEAAEMRAQGASRARVATVLAAAAANRAQAMELDNTSRALERQARELEINEHRLRRFTQSTQTVAMGLETVGIAMAVVGAVGLKFFFSSSKMFIEYQRQVALTKTQVDDFTTSMQQLSDIGLNVARNIAVPFQQIQPALFDIFSSMDVNVHEAEILLENFSKAAVAGQVEIQDAARGTIAILNAYNLPAKEVTRILDIQFKLVQKGVGTYEEFAKVFGRIVPAATRSGQSFETVAAMLAFMTRNGQSAAQASTAAARALELFTHPKAVDNLAKLGVKVKDAKGNFLPLIDILKDLRTELNKMPPADRVATIVDVFRGSGFNIQARRFLEQVVLRPGELEDFEQLLGEMTNSTGQFGEKYAEMADTAAAKTQLLANRWAVLRVGIGEAATPVLLKLVDFLGKIVEWFNKLSPRVKNIITQFGVWTTIGLILGGVLLATVGFLAALTAAFVVAGAEILVVIGVITGLISILAGAGTAIYVLWQKSSRFRQLAENLKGSFLELWHDVVVPFFQAVGKAWNEHMQPALNKLWDVITQRIIPVFNSWVSVFREQALPAIKEVAHHVSEFLAGAFRLVADLIQKLLVPAIERATKFYFDHKTEIDKVVGFLIILGKHLLIVGAFFAAVFGGTVAITVIGSLVLFINMVLFAVGAILQLISWVKSLWNWFKSIPGVIQVAVAGFLAWVSVIRGFLNEIPARLAAFFANAGTWLYNAGRNLIQGFINGIGSMFNSLRDKAESAARIVTNFLHVSSPAKMGPLSGTGDPYLMGKRVTKLFAEGLASGSAGIGPASSRLALAGTQGGVGVGSNATASKIVNQTFNITTQEIDPQYHSAQLGWRIENRMG